MFEFVSSGKIVFGPGSSRRLGDHCTQRMRHALVATGKHPARHQALLDALEASKVAVTCITVTGEPTIDEVDAWTKHALEAGCDGVVSIGGGSVIDAGKAIAALSTNPGGALRYVEVIGEGAPLTRSSLPHVAVPTTAGTGSEVTKNAVLGSTEKAVKVSLRADSMLPAVAIVDSELTFSLPPRVTAATGLDAFTQVVEPYLSPFANRFTDVLCRKAIELAPTALRDAVTDGANPRARDDMAFVSVSGGLALANAKLGSVHGLAGPLGGMFDAHHGALCGRLLPHALRVNLTALRERAPNHPTLQRYEDLARLLGAKSPSPEAAVDAVAQLVTDVGTTPLGTYGIMSSHFDEIITTALNSSSMKGNPIILRRNEVAAILEAAS